MLYMHRINPCRTGNFNQRLRAEADLTRGADLIGLTASDDAGPAPIVPGSGGCTGGCGPMPGGCARCVRRNSVATPARPACRATG